MILRSAVQGTSRSFGGRVLRLECRYCHTGYVDRVRIYVQGRSLEPQHRQAAEHFSTSTVTVGYHLALLTRLPADFVAWPEACTEDLPLASSACGGFGL